MFFSLEILRGHRLTFKAWNKKDGGGEFDFDTCSTIKSRCNKPFLFSLDRIHLEGSIVMIVYKHDSGASGGHFAFHLLPVKMTCNRSAF